MDASNLFPYCNYLAMAGWVLLLFVPKWKWTTYLTASIVMLLFSGLYTYLLGSSWGETDGGFGSLTEVRALFMNDSALLAGWVHYLAFDLFLGTWIVLNARKHEIHHLLILPSLFFTFMAGPFGVLLYMIIRSVRTKSLALENL